jgi:hypothetical protein
LKRLGAADVVSDYPEQALGATLERYFG